MRMKWEDLALVLVFLSGSTVAGEPVLSFTFDRVEDGTVWLAGGEGCAWETVSHGGGTFFVSDKGVETARDLARRTEAPGIVLNWNEEGRALEIVCRATRCSISSKAGLQVLTEGKTAKVAASAGVRFNVY